MRQSVSNISSTLQNLQRKRSIVLKSRIMQANRLQALVAGTLGYHPGMKDAERKKVFAEAGKVIKAVIAGDAEHDLDMVIKTTNEGIAAFDHLQASLERDMKKLVGKLPVSEWVELPEQRGFGLPMLAVTIGETGDLSKYAGPFKLYRRLGCAPWTFDGETKMGATWRSGMEGKLPAWEWERFGYSPRRRSIAYLIGEGLVKLNMAKVEASDGGDGETENDAEAGLAGPYRRLYLQAKAAAAVAHPDWKPLRCHRHGMLLATKRLLRNLWCIWNGKPVYEQGRPEYELLLDAEKRNALRPALVTAE